MEVHLPSFQTSDISEHDRLRRIKQYPCPELRCSKAFFRGSDLQRHRKCVHDCTPTLGDRHVYRCTIPGCAARRKRLDHFRKHVKQAHPGRDVANVVRDSAVPIAERSRLSPSNSVESRRSTLDTGTCQRSPSYAGLGHSDGAGSAHSHGGLDGSTSVMTTHIQNSSTSLSQLTDLTTLTCPGATADQNQSASAADDERLASSHAGVVNLLRRLQAKCVSRGQRSDPPTDGNDGQYVQYQGSFGGLPASGDGGVGKDESGKGKQPVRKNGGQDARGSDARSNGASQGPKGGLPCVFHLFQHSGDDPNHDCRTRKRNICYLWPHHYRHNFTCCWTCLRWFENRTALQLHRRPDNMNCTSPCLDPDCRNYDGPSTSAHPCRHSTKYSQVVIWKRLYREAHHLAPGVWIPDPTLPHQIVEDNLPRHHPMSPWSRQVPNQATALAPAIDMAIPGPQFADILAGIGGGVNGIPPNEDVQPTQAEHSDRDRLMFILEVLWACVNRRVPSWSPLIQDLWQSVPALDHDDILSQPNPAISATQTLQILGGHYAMLIQNPICRTFEVWLEVRQSTELLLGTHVEVPVECPWSLDQPAQPSTQPRGPPYRVTVRTPTFDPALESLIQPSLSTFNSGTGLVSTTSRDREPIPQAAIDATNELWHVRPDESSQNLSPQTPMDRRHSFSSLTSPSDGPYYSAHSSMSFTPFGGSGTPYAQNQPDALPSGDFSEFVTDSMYEDGDETELDDID